MVEQIDRMFLQLAISTIIIFGLCYALFCLQRAHNRFVEDTAKREQAILYTIHKLNQDQQKLQNRVNALFPTKRFEETEGLPWSKRTKL